MAATLARGALLVFAGFAALVGGGVTLVAATVGVCAAAGLVLYEFAHLFAYAFGVSFRWVSSAPAGFCSLVCPSER
jgi:hypothetical protein